MYYLHNHKTNCWFDNCPTVSPWYPLQRNKSYKWLLLSRQPVQTAVPKHIHGKLNRKKIPWYIWKKENPSLERITQSSFINFKVITRVWTEAGVLGASIHRHANLLWYSCTQLLDCLRLEFLSLSFKTVFCALIENKGEGRVETLNTSCMRQVMIWAVVPSAGGSPVTTSKVGALCGSLCWQA